jgi:hypothetical protein
MIGIVEIMGHRTRAGHLTDATIGGATMLRIEHPTDPELVEYYTPAALFAIRPCSLEQAVAAASWWARVEPPRELTAFDEFVLDDDDDEPPLPVDSWDSEYDR